MIRSALARSGQPVLSVNAMVRCGNAEGVRAWVRRQVKPGPQEAMSMLDAMRHDPRSSVDEARTIATCYSDHAGVRSAWLKFLACCGNLFEAYVIVRQTATDYTKLGSTTWAHLIAAAIRFNAPSSAQFFMAGAMREGLLDKKRNVEAFLAPGAANIIKAFSDSGRFDEAVVFYNKLIVDDLADVTVQCAILEAASNNGRIDECLALWKNIGFIGKRKRGYQAIITALSRVSAPEDIDRARAMIVDLVQESRNLRGEDPLENLPPRYSLKFDENGNLNYFEPDEDEILTS